MEQKYLKTVLFASIVILVYQGIANSVLGIISQFTHQNGNDWAGPLSTALLFLGSGLGSIYNNYIGKYPFKYTFFFGAFGYIIFISMSLIFMKLGFSTAVEILIFILSFIGGSICSVFYNSQFNYINYLSQIDKREVKYFGINMGLVQSSNIFGNLLSSILIQPIGQFLYVVVMDIAIFVTSLFFLRFKDPQRQQLKSIHQNDQIKQNNQTLLSQNETKQKKLLQKIPPFKACSSFAFSGIIITFIYCMLGIVIYRTFEDNMEPTELNHLTFLLFIFEGIGQFLGGLAVILLSKKIKNAAFSIIIVNTLFIVSVGIIFLGYYFQNKYFMGFGVILTGFSDCSTFALSLTVAGIWKQDGITAFNIFQSLTVTISAMIVVFVSFELFIGWILIFYVWNVIGMYLWHLQTTQKASKSIIPQ